MRKVYDCFLFFDEFDLLEARLHELDPVVERFVLVESCRTFSNEPKPFYFEENKQRFAKYLHKIIHIKLSRFPMFLPIWNPFRPVKMENHQRDCVRGVFKDCGPEDIILLGDVNEIPKLPFIETMQELGLDDWAGIRMERFFYAYNYRMVYHGETRMDRWEIKRGVWYGPAMVTNEVLKKTKPSAIRRKLKKSMHSKKPLPHIVQGGWKFSYMAAPDEMFRRIRQRGSDFTDASAVVEAVAERRDIFGRDMEFIAVNPKDHLPRFFHDPQVQQRLSSYFMEFEPTTRS